MILLLPCHTWSAPCWALWRALASSSCPLCFRYISHLFKSFSSSLAFPPLQPLLFLPGTIFGFLHGWASSRHSNISSGGIFSAVIFMTLHLVKNHHPFRILGLSLCISCFIHLKLEWLCLFPLMRIWPPWGSEPHLSGSFVGLQRLGQSLKYVLNEWMNLFLM